MTVALCTREDYDNNHDNVVSERIGSESGEAVHTCTYTLRCDTARFAMYAMFLC